MTLQSANAKTNSLKNDFGSGKGTSAPATWYIAFFVDNTMATELTGTGGISRIAVTNNDTNWSTAAGVTGNVGAINSASSTGAWASAAGFVALMSAAAGGDAWDGGNLASAVSVSAAGTVIQFAANALQVSA